MQSGPQPAVDVRAGLVFVPGSRLVMQGFTMLGAEAGLRFTEQVPAYLSNLHRLGLIWFSRDPVRNRERYQVLEVQPEVTEAIKRAGRFSFVIRRSIHLTPWRGLLQALDAAGHRRARGGPAVRSAQRDLSRDPRPGTFGG